MVRGTAACNIPCDSRKVGLMPHEITRPRTVPSVLKLKEGKNLGQQNA